MSERLITDYDVYRAIRRNDKEWFIDTIKNRPEFLKYYTDPSGRHLLEMIILYGKKETLKTLIEMGANPNTRNIDGETLLFSALKKCDYNVVRILLEAGANPFEQNLYKGKYITSWDYIKNELQSPGMLNIFCESFQKQLNSKIVSPIVVLMAIELGYNIDDVKKLIKKKKINLNYPIFENKKTSIEYLLDNKKFEIAQQLVDFVADLKHLSYNLSTLIDKYTKREQKEEMMFLLKNKAKLHEHADKNGNTLAHIGIATENEILLKETLDQFPELVNSRNNKGKTALHLACEYYRDKMNIIRFLMYSGADPSIVDNKNRTALDIAHETHNTKAEECISTFPSIEKCRAMSELALALDRRLRREQGNRVYAY